MPQPTIKPLTSLRGIAALAVMAYHLLGSMLGIRLFARGYLGVDLFFLLSGFILVHVYRNDLSVRSFLAARVARTYPLHLFMLLLLLPAFGQARVYTALPLLCNLTMTQAVCGVADSWNGVSWSLSAEWFAYILFPFLLGPTQRCPAWLAGMVVAICAVVLAAPGESLTATFGILALCRSFPEFLIGMVAYRAFQARWFSHWAWFAVAVASIAVTLGLSSLDVLVVLELAVVLLACPNVRFLAWRPLVFLGEISYSLYMVHGLTGLAAAMLELDGGIKDTVAIAVFAALLSLVFAVLTYRCVELPARAKLRDWLGGRTRPASLEAGPAAR